MVFQKIIDDLKLTKEQLNDKEIQKFVKDVAFRKQSGNWYQYWNGNGYCELNKKDGTMITTILDDKPFKAEFPLNCDMNVSNNCCIGCKFCYQGCTPTGKHADIKKFIEDKNSFLYSLHEGTELAINGNEPLHPDLELLFKFCKEKGVLANLTVNAITLQKHQEQIEKWLEQGLVHGIGISASTYNEFAVDWASKHSSAVIHTIAGITTVNDYSKMFDKNVKILILGYKDFGRGVDYKQLDSHIKDNINDLAQKLKDGFINHFSVVSFDNLAIEQLNPKSWLSPKQWETFYRGDDGSHTLFIDLVNETFAKNSIQSKENHKALLGDIRDMLNEVQKETK